MARENVPQRDEKERKVAGRLTQRLSQAGHHRRSGTSPSPNSRATRVPGPRQDPAGVGTGVELDRLETIVRAKRRDTITYGEMKWAVYDELKMPVGHSMFPTLMEAVNHESDGVQLLSIIVTGDTGKPSDGFLPNSANIGFDLPLQNLHRQVYDYFKQRVAADPDARRPRWIRTSHGGARGTPCTERRWWVRGSG